MPINFRISALVQSAQTQSPSIVRGFFVPKIEDTIMGMATKKPEQCEEYWQVAQEALRAAQKMPSGPERVEALKKAGQLRYDADEQRRAIEQEGERTKEAARLASD